MMQIAPVSSSVKDNLESLRTFITNDPDLKVKLLPELRSLGQVLASIQVTEAEQHVMPVSSEELFAIADAVCMQSAFLLDIVCPGCNSIGDGDEDKTVRTLTKKEKYWYKALLRVKSTLENAGLDMRNFRTVAGIHRTGQTQSEKTWDTCGSIRREEINKSALERKNGGQLTHWYIKRLV